MQRGGARLRGCERSWGVASTAAIQGLVVSALQVLQQGWAMARAPGFRAMAHAPGFKAAAHAPGCGAVAQARCMGWAIAQAFSGASTTSRGRRRGLGRNF
jgi:hypothetical protein